MRTVSAWSPPSIIDHPFWLHIWKHLSWEWWANSSILSISQTGEHRHPSKCLRGEEIDGGQPCASSCTTVVKMPRCREEDYAGGYWAIDQQLYRITFNQVLLGDLCEVQLWYLPKVETEFSLSLLSYPHSFSDSSSCPFITVSLTMVWEALRPPLGCSSWQLLNVPVVRATADHV